MTAQKQAKTVRNDGFWHSEKSLMAWRLVSISAAETWRPFVLAIQKQLNRKHFTSEWWRKFCDLISKTKLNGVVRREIQIVVVEVRPNTVRNICVFPDGGYISSVVNPHRFRYGGKHVKWNARNITTSNGVNHKRRMGTGLPFPSSQISEYAYRGDFPAIIESQIKWDGLEEAIQRESCTDFPAVTLEK